MSFDFSGCTIDDANCLRRMWYTLFMVWQIMHWVAIFIISAGSATVASQWKRIETIRQPLSLLVAITSALYAVLNPGERAMSYRQAWVGLNLAIIRESGLSDSVKSAVEVGEEIIARQAAPRLHKQDQRPK
ncbi:hypothetical protein [Methylobacterium sp. R2-1]|uniref:hypothetical protein n=1 Tax=Methylobacterium sp. R2-1 TaxID=2587064 RepID=UPI001622758C|nr:hypothetical protein [Methylobacterium sp. R2-1]MBB2963532.1 hypothetical protein [Methylobacterium sp. R2-1]